VRAASLHHQDQPLVDANDPYPAQEGWPQRAKAGVARDEGRLKAVVSVVRAHAQRYHTLLDENWQATDWSRPQVEQVLKRLESMLEALPVGGRIKTSQ